MMKQDAGTMTAAPRGPAWLRSGMRPLAVALVMLIAVPGWAAAQQPPEQQPPDQLTREQTVEMVSQIMSNIQAAFPTIEQASSLEPAMVKGILMRATTMVLELRDDLANNPYLRVSSFAVDFPSGVSVEFSFPPAADLGE
jgi:hypothetical protein